MYDSRLRIRKTKVVPSPQTVVLGTKVNNMASRVKGLVCLWHHQHGRTYRSNDFSGGGRSRVFVTWRIDNRRPK